VGIQIWKLSECVVGIAGGASCEASIERIVLCTPREAGRHPHHSLPVKQKRRITVPTNAMHICGDAYAGKAMQEGRFEPTKTNGAIVHSPGEAAMRF
jgi:hypothetical protein